MGTRAACVQLRASERRAVAVKSSRLKSRSSHEQVRQTFQSAMGVLFCCFLLSMLYIPRLVRCDDATRQPESQVSLSVLSILDRHFFHSTVLESFTRTDDQKELPTGGVHQLNKNCPVIEDNEEGAPSVRKNTEGNANKRQGWLWQLRDLPISCSASVESDLVQRGSDDLSLSSIGLKHSSLFSNSVSTKPNVAIDPPALEWGPCFLFTPSLGSLTIVNTWNDSGLFVFQPYSTNSDFYTTGFQETTLPPGGMMSIHIIFLPKKVGLVEGVLVVQTSSGGFLIQLQGFGVESPYRLQPLPVLNTTGEKLFHTFTLYNPFDEPLLVEEASAWIADFRKRSQHSSDSCEDTGIRVSCKRDTVATDRYQASVSSSNQIQLMGEGTTNEREGVVQLRPAGKWEIQPHSSNAIVDLEASVNKEDVVQGALCIKLVNLMEDKPDNLIVPLNMQPGKGVSYHSTVHTKPETLDFGLFTHKEQESRRDVVLVNPGLDSILVEEIHPSCHDVNIVDIEYAENLVLKPESEGHAATVTYVASEPRTSSEDGSSACAEYQLVVKINSTTDPYVKVPYRAVVLHGTRTGLSPDAFGEKSKTEDFRATASTVNMGKTNQDLQLQKASEERIPVLKNPETTFWALELDEALQQEYPDLNFHLSARNYVLQDSELVFPMTPVGKEEILWVRVRNPSDKPIVVQLLLSSKTGTVSCMNNEGAPVICCDQDHSLSDPRYSLDTLSVKHLGASHIQNAIFRIAEGDVINVTLQPNCTDALGPIVFHPIQPYNSTGVLILQNNLTGIELIPVQGYGGSACLTFLEGNDAVQTLELDFNSNFQPFPAKKSFKEHIDDLFDDRGAKSTCYKRMFREFMAKNTGDLPLQVDSLMLTGGGGGSHGFRIDSTQGFHLEPGQYAKLVISYQPDFTTGITEKELQLTTSFGMLAVPLRASLPEQMPSFCHKALLVSKVKRLCLHICLVALFLVLLVFVKMLKQERAAASDRSQWPSAGSSTRFFRHFAMKTGEFCVKTGGGIYSHDGVRQKLTETLSFSMSNGFDSTRNLNRHCGSFRILGWASSIAGVIVTSAGKFLITIKSVFISEALESFPNFKVRISTVGSPVASLTKSNSGHSKRGSSIANISNRMSDKKGNITHPRIQSLKVGDQPFSAVNTTEGALLSNLDLSSGDCLQKEVVAQPMPSSASSPVLDKAQSLSPKAGLEKDKGKRKKRRNNFAFMRQEVDSVVRSRSLSPSSSPSSPATSSNSSRPGSPFLRQGTLSSTTMGAMSTDSENHFEIPLEHSQKMLSPMNMELSMGSQQRGLECADCFTMENTEAGCIVSKGNQSAVDMTWGLPVINTRRNRKAKAMPAAKSLEDIAQREASVSKSDYEKNLGKSRTATAMANSARNRAALTTSATFPRRGQRSDMAMPAREVKNFTMSASTSSLSLVSTSIIAPHARAPGTRLSKQGVEEPWEKQGAAAVAASNYQVDDGISRNSGLSFKIPESLFEHTNAADQGAGDLVYDIWGDHFAEISRGTRSSWSSIQSLGQNNLTTEKMTSFEDSHSLFSKPGFLIQGGTVNYGNHSMPASSTPGFSVFSAADPFLSSHPLEVLFGSHSSCLDQESQKTGGLPI